MSVAEHVDLSGATLHLKPAIYFEVFDPCWCLVFWIIQPSLEVAQFLSMRIFPGVSKMGILFPTEWKMGVLFPTEWKNGSIIPNCMAKWEYYSQLNGKIGILFPTEWKNGSIIPNWMEKWEYYSQLNGKMGVLFPTEWKNGSIIPNWMEKWEYYSQLNGKMGVLFATEWKNENHAWNHQADTAWQYFLWSYVVITKHLATKHPS